MFKAKAVISTAFTMTHLPTRDSEKRTDDKGRAGGAPVKPLQISQANAAAGWQQAGSRLAAG
jgi:hypothetical protein